MEQIHLMPVELSTGARGTLPRVQRTPEYAALKRAFDSWCAIWFWPADTLEAVPTPSNFYELPPETQDIVDQIADELHFFHWELEFPDSVRACRAWF